MNNNRLGEYAWRVPLMFWLDEPLYRSSIAAGIVGGFDMAQFFAL